MRSNSRFVLEDRDGYVASALEAGMPEHDARAIRDFGIVEQRRCGCPLDAAGYRIHLRGVRSVSKLTVEGVSLVGSEMVRILEESFDVEEYLVKSVRAQGVRLSTREIKTARFVAKKYPISQFEKWGPVSRVILPPYEFLFRFLFVFFQQVLDCLF